MAFAKEPSTAVGNNTLLESTKADESGLDAIEAIYRTHFSDVLGFLRSRFTPPPDHEDIAQNTFLRFAQANEQGVIENIKAFLFRTARNLVIDYHRSPKNVLASHEQQAYYENTEKSDAEAPENVFTNRQALSLLERAIMALPERDRGFVLMNRLDDMSYTDIAKHAGMSRSGVQKIITQSLAKCMEAVYAGEDERAAGY